MANIDSKPYKFEPITSEQQDILNNATPHLLYCGQGGCGKTHTGAAKALIMGSYYPHSVIALIRKKRVDLTATLWKYFVEKVLTDDNYVLEKNDTDLFRRLRNGTEIHGVGLDSTGSVNKLASREYNFIVVEEATEITEEDFDTKIMRTLRLPQAPFHQILLLCNPSSKHHWIYKRFYEKNDKSYCVIEGKTLQPPWLPKSYYEFLQNLTGIFKRRYVDGEWVTAEGEVYPFDPSKHIIKPFDIPEHWERVVSMDFGFGLMHACCVQWWAISPEKRWYCYRQIYTTHHTVEDLRPIIKNYMFLDGIPNQPIICDHDADGRATLQKRGIKTIPARKNRIGGQQAVHDLIANNMVFFMEGNLVEEDVELKLHKLPTCTEQEFPTYVWANKSKQDMVNKLDHGQDAMRYAIKTRKEMAPLNYDTQRYEPKVLSRA